MEEGLLKYLQFEFLEEDSVFIERLLLWGCYFLEVLRGDPTILFGIIFGETLVDGSEIG